jgi:uncharacterized membrane protein YfcA
MKLSLVAVIGGMVAGIVGIGGGLIYNPLLLEFGLPPIVTTATSMYLVLFASLANSFQYILADKIDYHYALWFLLPVAIGSFSGLFLVNKLVEKTGRSSLIVILFAAVLALASVVCPVYSAFDLAKESSDGTNIWGFHPIC